MLCMLSKYFQEHHVAGYVQWFSSKKPLINIHCSNLRVILDNCTQKNHNRISCDDCVSLYINHEIVHRTACCCLGSGKGQLEGDCRKAGRRVTGVQAVPPLWGTTSAHQYYVWRCHSHVAPPVDVTEETTRVKCKAGDDLNCFVVVEIHTYLLPTFA